MHKPDTVFACYVVGHADQTLGIRLGHGRKTWSPLFVILSPQRVLREQIYVIRDDHHVSHAELLVHSSRGIAYKESAYTQFFHNPHGECDLLHVISLVIVETSLHGHHVFSAEITENEFPAVPLYR